MSNTIQDEWSDGIPGGGYVGIEEYPGEKLPYQWSVQTADDRLVGRGYAATDTAAREAMEELIRSLWQSREGD